MASTDINSVPLKLDMEINRSSASPAMLIQQTQQVQNLRQILCYTWALECKTNAFRDAAGWIMTNQSSVLELESRGSCLH